MKPNADLQKNKHPTNIDHHIKDHRDHEGPPHTINKSWDTKLKAAAEQHSYGLSGIPEQVNHRNPNDLEICCSHSSIAPQQNPWNYETEMDKDPGETHKSGKVPTLSPNQEPIYQDGSHSMDTNIEELSSPLTITASTSASVSPERGMSVDALPMSRPLASRSTDGGRIREQ